MGNCNSNNTAAGDSTTKNTDRKMSIEDKIRRVKALQAAKAIVIKELEKGRRSSMRSLDTVHGLNGSKKSFRSNSTASEQGLSSEEYESESPMRVVKHSPAKEPLRGILKHRFPSESSQGSAV
eukprot:Hpha_TRINITY_DN15659_c3_g4::TRINITY_DN15659_c3_g4_i1::g.101353::m.101353